MPELREVFEMVTKQTEPDIDAWREQERRQRSANRNRKTGAFALVAAIGLAAIVLIVAVRTWQRDEPTPAVRPTATPEEVAEAFLEDYASFDADAAMAYLSGSADISGLMMGVETAATTQDELRLNLATLEALRYRQMLIPCEATSTTSAGTDVRCAFDLHLFGSDELDLGPYGGNAFTLTIRDGEIERASVSFNIDYFSPEVWEPVAAWVADKHPRDVEVLYEDAQQSNLRLSDESVALWAKYLPRYIDAAKRGNA